jgi:hypothetical protein
LCRDAYAEVSYFPLFYVYFLCFSSAISVPAAQCVIDHHCENRADKARLATRAANMLATRLRQQPDSPEGNLLGKAVRNLPLPAEAWYCRADALKRRQVAPSINFTTLV